MARLSLPTVKLGDTVTVRVTDDYEVWPWKWVTLETDVVFCKGAKVSIENVTKLPDDVITNAFVDKHGRVIVKVFVKGTENLEDIAPTTFTNEAGLWTTMRCYEPVIDIRIVDIVRDGPEKWMRKLKKSLKLCHKVGYLNSALKESERVYNKKAPKALKVSSAGGTKADDNKRIRLRPERYEENI